MGKGMGKKGKGKKKSGKKGKKGKKGKGKKGSGKGATPEKVKLQWPWFNKLSQWMGPTDKTRVPLRRQFRFTYLDRRGSFPLCDELEWTRLVMNYKGPFKDEEAECMVKIITTLCGFEGDRKVAPDNFVFFAASLRAQKGIEAFKRMFDHLNDLLSMLDCFPCIDDLLDLYSEENISKKAEGRITQTHMEEFIKSVSWSYGDEAKVRRDKLEREFQTYLEGGPIPTPTMMAGEVLDEAGNVVPQVTGVDGGEAAADGPIVRKRSSVVTSAGMPSATRDLVYDEDLMVELARVEHGIKLVCQSDKQLVLLWKDMDFNGNDGVDLNEVTAYLKTRYPILGAGSPLTLAFTQTIKDEHKEFMKTVDEVELLRDPKVHLHPDMQLKRAHIRSFLIRLFYYAKIWCAFKRLDVVKDFEVELDEFKGGYKTFVKDLSLEEDEGSEALFGKMQGAGSVVTFPSMARWYEGEVEEVDLLNADWFPPDQVPEEKPLGVTMEVLTDMVLHCHYITRA